ncbi:MAG: SDR family NAD(P)-dependent oxidoreductase [Paracoccus sp. (in: a-proteobacteria)]
MPQTESVVSVCDSETPVISGLSCRVAGARGQAAMWNALIEGRCTITSLRDQSFDPEMYLDRFQTRRGKAYTLASGQIDGIYDFDAGFFGISPREAQDMDPQQCMMLHAVWEAVEDSGLSVRDLAGERTGVFVGSSIVENLSLYYADTARTNSGFSLGNTLCVIANRVSSIFDFGGPSYVLDAACASSLYALHQAAEALRTGELDTAIVGGVHALLAPGGFVGFSQARMLSPTGLCRAFDADADGYVRSEACVAVVLQRPGIAKRMMSRQRGHLLATGVNTDGAISQLTVPSAIRQESLLDAVMLRSDRDPDDLSFYEAHGTGTQVGDPVEAQSIGRSLAMLRQEPLLIGSAKTNFGHSEPASGLVGLAKTLLAMQHRALPASLHFNTPNPNIDFDNLNLQVNTKLRPLDDNERLIAGINSFGFGGTNVAAVVETAEEVPSAVYPVVAVKQIAQPWLLLSAASLPSLSALAAKWADRLEQADPDECAALCAASAMRAGLSHRIALPLDRQSPDLLRQPLSEDDNGTVDGITRGTASFLNSRTVFAFPGNGAQVPGMGVSQYRDDPVFRNSFDRVAKAMAAEGVPDLVDLMHAPNLAEQMGSPQVAQPILFAFQVALAESIIAAGIRPDAVIGHSVGEIAALHVAGCFDLPAAARIITTRSRAFEQLRGRGRMAVIAASEADVERAISGLNEPDLAIAAVNSPRSVTVAGPDGAITKLGRVTVGGKRLAMVKLKVEVPYHSPLVEPLHQQFLNDLEGISFTSPEISVAGSAVGRMLRMNECGTDYLWHNARDCVRFSDALRVLADAGPCHAVEISPVAVLQGNVRDLARYGGVALDYFLPVSGRDDDAGQDEPDNMAAMRLAAYAWAQGISVDLEKLCGTRNGVAPDMPGYPWDESEHRSILTPDGLDAWGELGARNLIGKRADRDVPSWVRDITATGPTWVADHKLGQDIVLAGAVLVEMALDAGAEIWPDSMIELMHFDILAPTIVEGEGVRIRTEVDLETGKITFFQRPRISDVSWLTIARGILRKGQDKIPAPARPPRDGFVPVDDLYDFLSASGLAYGPAFRRMLAASPLKRNSIWVELSEPTINDRFILDPMALDGAFHGLAAIARELSQQGGQDETLIRLMRDGAVLLPTRVEQMRLIVRSATVSLARLQLIRTRRRSLVVRIDLYDQAGACVAQLQEAEFTVVRPDAVTRIEPARIINRQARLRLPGQAVALPQGWASADKIIQRFAPLDAPPKTRLSQTIAGLHTHFGSDDPARDEILRSVLELEPDLADDLRGLMLRQAGESALDVALYGLIQRYVWTMFARIGEELQRKWRKGERFSLLISGIPEISFLRALATSDHIDRVAVTAPTPEGCSLLMQVLPPDLAALLVETPEDGAFDVIFAAGNAVQAEVSAAPLAPGGLLIGLEAPDFLMGDHEDRNGVTGYVTAGDVVLRVHAWRKSTASVQKDGASALRLALAEDMPDDLPQDIAKQVLGRDDEGRKPTHRVLFHLYQPAEDLTRQITSVLLQLKTVITEDPSPLVLITLRCEDEPGFDLFAAALRSATVSAANEYGDHSIRFVALHDVAAGDTGPDLADLIRLSDQESALHVQNGKVMVDRLGLLPVPSVTAPAVELRQHIMGRLDTLEWTPARKSRLGPEDVEIEVLATGLNFRDVMSARGLLSERILDAGASGAGMGMEYAGIVRRTGKQAKIAVGTQVMGFARSAFASHVTLPEAAVSVIPEGLSPETAAAIPVAFVTAWEGLINLARIMPGETVLIHGGAGGVGLAAIQIARMAGARILATAGTEEKRTLARAYGADAVFSSRDLSFADKVMTATQGKGVNVVLNSLSGEAMQRSVGCLSPFGRFIELGKRDYLEGTSLDLRPFSRNLTYYGMDLDQRLAASPERIAAIMSEIRDAFAQDKLRPIPVTCFPADMAEEAFRHMLAARHTGKIVIVPRKPGRKVRGKPVQDDWVIVGGTGGVGLTVAKWLLSTGAAHVHLLSRSGELKLGTGDLGRWVENVKNLSVHAVDATDEDAMKEFFDLLGSQNRRVGGVIHAAMVLRDRLLKDLDGVEAAQVIAAKLRVAEILAARMRDKQITPDYVIFFSSIAARLGNPGQVAYSAGNSAVEVLAGQLRKEGFPVSAIGWGPVNDIGYLTRNAVVATQLSKMDGIGFLRSHELVSELERAIRDRHLEDYCFAPVVWSRLAPILPALSQSLFARLVPASALNTRSAGALTEAIKSLDWSAALALTESELRTILSGIMRIPPDQFDPHRPLNRYGIDSLMALELRLEVERRFGSTLKTFSVTEDMTAARLAAVMVERVKSEDITEGNNHPDSSED